MVWRQRALTRNKRTQKSRKKRIPSSMNDTDLLHGLSAIAEHLRLSTDQVRYLANKYGLPTFKFGKTVCARRSSVNAWLAKSEIANRSQTTSTNGDT